MECTKCGQRVRPVVAVDIDGTLGDYHGHFIMFAQQYLGTWIRDLWPSYDYDKVLDGYTGAEPFKQWCCDVLCIDEPTWRDIKLAYRQGGMKRTMRVRPGAVEVCQAIRAAGAELWLTTTRPYLRLDNIDPDTRHWLERHSITYDGLLYDELKYQRLAEIVDKERVVAVVDDLEEMWGAAAAVFGWQVPILMRCHFNSAVVSEADAKDFTDLWEQLNERIKEWEQTHE